MPLNTKIPQQIVSSTTQALSVKRGEPAMLVADMDRGTIVLMDGKTYGGIPAAREDTQIRAGSSAITVNDGEWSALTGTINIGINPEGFIVDVVSPTDKVLAVGDDGKIAAQLSVAYDETSGLFSLKGKDGETISSFTLVIPTGITPKSVALVENPDGQEPGLYLEFVFIDDDDVEIKLYADMDVLKDVYTAGRGITISDDRVISVDEDAISGVIADDLIEDDSGLKVVNDKLHLADHASETPEYGLGDEDNYGHVRLADAGDSRATVVAGIAATPAAVKDVDDRAVHKEGDETISGVKTFVDTPKVTTSDGGTVEVATLTDLKSTVWGKRVDEIPEDTDNITFDMPIGAIVVKDDNGSGGASPASVIFQVIGQDGQKALAAVPTGDGGIATEEAPGVVQPDGVTTRVDNTGVLSAIGGNLLLNSEQWILESGTFEAPVTGWYSILLFGGGGSGDVSLTSVFAAVGYSGKIKAAFVYLSAGEEVPVVIGAGGPAPEIGSYNNGGETSFGDISTADSTACFAGAHGTAYSSSMRPRIIAQKGAGLGGGTDATWVGGTQAEVNAACSAQGHFGGSGASFLRSDNSYAIGAGAQGSVLVRWHDPAKAAGPTE